MMRLPVFRLHQPTTVAEALAHLESSTGSARVVAGGTDLWPNMKRRHQSASDVISLKRVAELRGIRTGSDGAVRIGATTSLAAVAADPTIRETHPALARAAASVSSPAVRNMATLGGNLCLDTRCTYYNQNEEWRRSIDYCMKEGGSVCWVAPQSPRCWAISASDTAPVLCVLGATVKLVSPDGERDIPIADLYADDGIGYMTAHDNEILTEVEIPPPGGRSTAYWKLRRRGSIDFAVLTVAAGVRLDGTGRVDDASVWLGAVASAPVHSDAAVQALLGKPVTAEVIADAAQAARKIATPLDNTDFTLQWRSKMVIAYVEAALREAAGLPTERLPPKHAL